MELSCTSSCGGQWQRHAPCNDSRALSARVALFSWKARMINPEPHGLVHEAHGMTACLRSPEALHASLVAVRAAARPGGMLLVCKTGFRIATLARAQAMLDGKLNCTDLVQAYMQARPPPCHACTDSLCRVLAGRALCVHSHSACACQRWRLTALRATLLAVARSCERPHRSEGLW